MAKFPTYEEMARNVAEKALDEIEYNGKMLRQWIEIISASEHGTNLAEVGTDCISRQAAIDAICSVCGMQSDFHNCEWYQKDSKYQLCEEINSLRRLPSAQPEQTNCDYCHEDVDGYVKPIEKNGHAFVRFGMNGWKLELKAKGWHGETKIQYCPMCGRKLKNDK